MTAQEKRPIVFLAIDIILFLSYYSLLMRINDEKVMDLGELPFWGAAILLLVPLMIISRIMLYVLYSIINTLVTQEQEEKFITDEFGKFIKLIAARNFSNTFMAGFIITMGMLILGISATTMFKLFFFSLFAAFVAYNCSVFYFMKKGV